MSLTFSELILYLLPGFLGLWVYKRVVQEEIDARSESTQIAIGLLLGLSGLFMLFLLNRMFLCFIGRTDEIREISRYISLESLRLSDRGGSYNFCNDVHFWSSYITLCILSSISGSVSGYLNERGLSITRYISRKTTQKLGLPEKVPSESALRILVNRLHKPTELMLARVYKLGESREEAIIGWVTGYSDVGNEILLTRLELFRAVEDMNKRLELQACESCINYDSGIVIEIYDFEEGKMKKFEEDIRRKYREHVKAP